MRIFSSAVNFLLVYLRIFLTTSFGSDIFAPPRDIIPIMELKSRDFKDILPRENILETTTYQILPLLLTANNEKIAAKDSDYYQGINALTAYREAIIAEEEYLNLLKVTRERLLKVGVEDLNLRGDHLLISFDSKGNLVTDDQGNPEIRICNFEFLKKIK